MKAALRVSWYAVFAVGVLLLELAVRLLVGHPYRGATAAIVAALGIAIVPFVVGVLPDITMRLAAVPALGVSAFIVLLTTISIAGVPLGDTSVRAATALSVLLLAALSMKVTAPQRSRSHQSTGGRVVLLLLLVVVVEMALAHSRTIVSGFPPPGQDWAHYLLYADQVAQERQLLIENPYWMDGTNLIADDPGIGALYGSLELLDGFSSQSLGVGIGVISALSCLSVFAAVATLWGPWRGLLGSAVWAVAPVRREVLVWHGLATTLALLLLPLLLLGLALAFRNRSRREAIVFIALSWAGLLAAHKASAMVAGLIIALAVAVRFATASLVATGIRGRILGAWHDGPARTIVRAAVFGSMLAAGVVAHAVAQVRDLGPPPSYRVFRQANSFGLDTLPSYHGYALPALFVVSVCLLITRRAVRDPAVVATLVFAAGASLVTLLWLPHIAFDYRRAIYYVAIPMAFITAIAPFTARRARYWVTGYAVIVVIVGLNGFYRNLDPDQGLARAYRAVATDIRREAQAGDAPVIVADRCVSFVAPYMLQARTYGALREFEVGFRSELEPARLATRVLAGGVDGRRIASELGVRYVVYWPVCTPGAAQRLGGSTIVRYGNLRIVRLDG